MALKWKLTGIPQLTRLFLRELRTFLSRHSRASGPFAELSAPGAPEALIRNPGTVGDWTPAFAGVTNQLTNLGLIAALLLLPQILLAADKIRYYGINGFMQAFKAAHLQSQTRRVGEMWGEWPTALAQEHWRLRLNNLGAGSKKQLPWPITPKPSPGTDQAGVLGLFSMLPRFMEGRREYAASLGPTTIEMTQAENFYTAALIERPFEDIESMNRPYLVSSFQWAKELTPGIKEPPWSMFEQRIELPRPHAENLRLTTAPLAPKANVILSADYGSKMMQSVLTRQFRLMSGQPQRAALTILALLSHRLKI